MIFTILWMGVIFIFSSQNGTQSSLNNLFVFKIFDSIGLNLSTIIVPETINYIIRKMAHLTEYFILGALLYKTCRCYLYVGFEIISIIAGFLYACSDEFHQYFVPGRSAKNWDVLIDTSGVVLGVLFVSFCFYRIKSKRQLYI